MNSRLKIFQKPYIYWTIGMFIFILLVGFTIWILFSQNRIPSMQNTQVTNIKAHILKVTGPVSAKNNKEKTWTTAKINSTLTEGYYIKTDNKAEVTISFDSGDKIIIREKSQIYLKKLVYNQILIEQTSGKTYSVVKKSSNKQYIVSNNLVKARALGTEFDFERSQDKSITLSVYKNSVLFQTPIESKIIGAMNKAYYNLKDKKIVISLMSEGEKKIQDESGDEDDQGESGDQPGENDFVIDKIEDSIGNSNSDSWAKTNSGGNCCSNTIHEGDQITFKTTVSNPSNQSIKYRYSIQLPGGSFITRQDWGDSDSYTWSVNSSDIGSGIIVMVSISNNDGNDKFSDGDDYTYMSYNVEPKGSTKPFYPTISSVRDSLGNSNTSSWGKDTGGGSCCSNTLKVGNKVTFKIYASDPNNSQLQYRFEIQPQGGSFVTRRDWSTSNTFTWVVADGDVGTDIFVVSEVKNADNYLKFGFADDYNYMVYKVVH